jgi:transposase InsO family protein
MGMTKPHVIVLAITHQKLTKQQASTKYQVSQRWINILLNRYKTQGLSGLEPQSRKPKTNPNQTPQHMVDLILQTRYELTQQGFDNGAKTIAWNLTQQGVKPPSHATIWRVLKRNGAINPQPKKRPKSSYIRFEAEQPNETWQSDFTHWPLADGTDIEILNWLDDHSRFLLSCTAHKPVRGPDVVSTFLDAVSEYGPPQSTLTDNGLVYTNRFIGGKNPFEYTIANLGIKQKNGNPGHPQTQGKIERFHQTLKRFLAQQPKAKNIPELQQQLNIFKHRYNNERPHTALKNNTPNHAYNDTVKAKPTGSLFDAYRVRTDKTDATGKVTLRRAGVLHKLGTGRSNARTPVLLLIDENYVTVTHKHTGEILSHHKIEPTQKYWPKTTNPQG